MTKRYSNGKSSNTLTREDAEMILANTVVENWMADRMFTYFGGYYTSSNAVDELIRSCESALNNLREGNKEEAQSAINDYTKYVRFFNEGFDGDSTAFDFAAYEARKNMATDRQISYLTYLLKKANRTADLTNMTKAEASALISELKGE